MRVHPCRELNAIPKFERIKQRIEAACGRGFAESQAMLAMIGFCLFAHIVRASEIYLEPGEVYRPRTTVSRVWIEKKEVAAADTKEGLQIRALQPGKTWLRLDSQLRLLRVLELNAKNSLIQWQKAVKRFQHLSVNTCGIHICLSGHLTDIRYYHRLIKISDELSAPILMAFTVPLPLRKELQRHMAAQLRSRGFTPQRVIFDGTWRSYYRPGSVNNALAVALKDLGVELVERENAAQLADNIEVSVKMLEVSKSFSRKYGISWPDHVKTRLIDQPLDAALVAAEASGDAKILASPKLVCRSGKEAEFFAGGEFPVKVTTARSSHIEWKKYGIGLRLKPNLDPLGQLNLQIDTEISTVDLSLKVDDMPGVKANRVSSFFDLIENKTVSLSGLLRSEDGENQEGLPFLQNIPVLGHLFKSKNYLQNKSELIILVTPRLLDAESEGAP